MGADSSFENPLERVPARPGNFETTHWSLVLAASDDSHSKETRVALETLCRTYWYPLFAFLRRRGHSAPDAQDLVQGFFAHILARRDLQAVRKERGRFRSYLLAALKNYTVNEWKRAKSQKRGGGQIPISLDDLVEPHAREAVPVDQESPDLLYDKEWARTLLERVIAMLREESAANGKESQFEMLVGFLVGTTQTRSQMEIAQDLGLTEGAVKQAVFRLRQRFRKLLQSEVSNTVATPGDVDEELRHLVAALRS